MKKRSLVAALAMLVVSAIVLTSSTYAWFASNATATVSDISATVTNNNGSLTVAASGTYAANEIKKTAITASDYDFGRTSNTLNPVSMSMDSGAPLFNKVSFEEGAFTNITGAAENADYITYQFKAEYVNGADKTATIEISPSFTRGADFLYGIVKVTANNTATYYFYNSADSYEPVKSMTSSSVVDTNGNSIIDSGDTGYVQGDMGVTTGATIAESGKAVTLMTVDAQTTAEATVDVYIWAEGQDAQCQGTVNASSAAFNFSLTVA